jgi:hypothetical protein
LQTLVGELEGQVASFPSAYGSVEEPLGADGQPTRLAPELLESKDGRGRQSINLDLFPGEDQMLNGRLASSVQIDAEAIDGPHSPAALGSEGADSPAP